MVFIYLLKGSKKIIRFNSEQLELTAIMYGLPCLVK